MLRISVPEDQVLHFVGAENDRRTRRLSRTIPVMSQNGRNVLVVGVGAEEYAKKGRRPSWIWVLLRPPYRFFRMYVFRLGFLDGRAGFLLAAQDAYSVFLKYATLWERGRRERPS